MGRVPAGTVAVGHRGFWCRSPVCMPCRASSPHWVCPPQEKLGLHLGQIAALTANWNHLGDGDLGSSFCVLAPPLRSHLGSEASVIERGGDAGRKCYLGVQPVPHGLRRRHPPPGGAPPQTYLAAGAVAVGRLAQHPPGRVPSRPFTCQVTAEQEGTHFPPSAPDPRPPVGDSHPYPSRHRGREAATPRHLTEEMKDVKSAQRSVGAPSGLASWVRGYRPHLSSA